MNIEDNQHIDSDITFIGERLRCNRKRLNLTQQEVAKRLCLKVSMVCDIENGKIPKDLSMTFLRGYIHSYAKLVKLSEKELPKLSNKILDSEVSFERYCTMNKNRTRYEGWIMLFTWLVVFWIIGITGIWWWQTHQAQKRDIVANLNEPLETNNQAVNEKAKEKILNEEALASLIKRWNVLLKHSSIQKNQDVISLSSLAGSILLEHQHIDKLPINHTPVSIASANPLSEQIYNVSQKLVLNFNASCWIEVKNSKDQVLFSGIKNEGSGIQFFGEAPYHLIIGNPSAVKLFYDGENIDLSSYIKNNQVAKLILGSP